MGLPTRKILFRFWTKLPAKFHYFLSGWTLTSQRMRLKSARATIRIFLGLRSFQRFALVCHARFRLSALQRWHQLAELAAHNRALNLRQTAARSSSFKMADTTQMRCAPAARTSSRFAKVMPPMGNHGMRTFAAAQRTYCKRHRRRPRCAALCLLSSRAGGGAYKVDLAAEGIDGNWLELNAMLSRLEEVAARGLELVVFKAVRVVHDQRVLAALSQLARSLSDFLRGKFGMN